MALHQTTNSCTEQLLVLLVETDLQLALNDRLTALALARPRLAAKSSVAAVS